MSSRTLHHYRAAISDQRSILAIATPEGVASLPTRTGSLEEATSLWKLVGAVARPEPAWYWSNQEAFDEIVQAFGFALWNEQHISAAATETGALETTTAQTRLEKAKEEIDKIREQTPLEQAQAFLHAMLSLVPDTVLDDEKKATTALSWNEFLDSREKEREQQKSKKEQQQQTSSTLGG